MRFEVLKGQTLTKIKINKEFSSVLFITETGKYQLEHRQDCCESVWLDDVVGDPADLLHSPLLMAELVTRDKLTQNSRAHIEDYESATWSFYKLATVKGYVTLRWCGTSNGYYSETVDFNEVTDA
jgi:hypothetical protein